MGLPLIPIISGLAQVAPVVAGWLGGKDAEQKAEKVAKIARVVTGADEVHDAVQRIVSNPDLAVKFQQAVMAYQAEMYVSETARLVAVNETMRAEGQSGDPYQRRWRPTFGYIAAGTWAVQGITVFGLMAYVVVTDPSRTADAIGAITGLVTALADHWLYAMTVLGVAVWKRSEDKKAATGGSGPGILGSLAERLRR